MNYFNTSRYDDDQWIEIIKNKINPDQYEFTDSKLASFALGLTTPAPPPTPTHNNFSYFITIAFPTNQKYNIKHLELHAHNRTRIVFSPIKYGDCTQDEQYKWLTHTLTKHINQVSDGYDLFFEQTKEGNLHIHGRLKFDNKRKTKKDVKALFHRMFETSTQYKNFIDIKDYDHKRWTDYDHKTVKTYQTLEYPHFKNI